MNEEAEKFDLRSWYKPCRTYGCLVGNYVIKQNINWPTDWERFSEEEFNLTDSEVAFLFAAENATEIAGIGKVCGWHILDPRFTRPVFDKAKALNRVRKFIYYNLHKREMLYEEDGRVKESARRAEGDHMIMEKVLNEIHGKQYEKNQQNSSYIRQG